MSLNEVFGDKAVWPRIPAYPDREPEKLGDMTWYFQLLRGLRPLKMSEKSEMTHELLHVMTGYDDSLHKEVSLRAFGNGFHGEAEDVELFHLHHKFRAVVLPGFLTLEASPTQLRSMTVRAAQWAFEAPSREEIRAQTEFGRDVKQAFEALTGTAPASMSIEDLEDIDVRDIDFTVQAREITEQYMSDHNREAEQCFAEVTHNQSMALRLQPLPKPGPWWGKHCEFFPSQTLT